MAVCWTLWSDSFQDSILQKKKKKKKHIHVWRNKVGQFNQSKDNESACNAGDLSSIPGLGRSPGGRPGNPLQYSCLENPVDRGAWRAYSPQGRKESVTTEQLTLSRFTCRSVLQAWYVFLFAILWSAALSLRSPLYYFPMAAVTN